MRDRVFRHKSLKGFDQKMVAVRLLGGKETTAESRKYWLLHACSSFPDTAVHTHDGVILWRGEQLSRPGQLWQLLRFARQEEQNYRRGRDSWGDAPGSWLYARGLYIRALLAYRKATEGPEPAAVEDLLRLADIYHRLGRPERQIETLARLIHEYPQHEGRIYWEMDKATSHLSDTAFFEDWWPGDVRHQLAKVRALEGMLDQGLGLEGEVIVRDRIVAAYEQAALRETRSDKQSEYEASRSAQQDWIAKRGPVTLDAPGPTLATARALVARRITDRGRITEMLRVLADSVGQPGWIGGDVDEVGRLRKILEARLPSDGN